MMEKLVRYRATMLVCFLFACACNKPQQKAQPQVAKAATTSDARKFDLICDGSEILNDKMSSKTHTNYHVDLDSGTWCADDCKRIFNIVDFQPGELTLGVAASATNEISNIIKINRVNGQLDGTVIAKTIGFESHETASCRVGPYAGMPTTKF